MRGFPAGAEQQRSYDDTQLQVVRGDVTRGTKAQEMERLRCKACREVIGVYEPLIVDEGSSTRITSHAAEPNLRANARALFHRDCLLPGDQSR